MKTQKTILIIEDEKSLREALVDVLSTRNFIPIEARNGKEGVRFALAKHPDLILLDIMMPEMDGMGVFNKVRENTWGENVPIIILTNLSASKDQNIGDIGADPSTFYLIKSDWKIHDIVKKIESLLK